jgi:GTPase SAR1 family protein
MTTISCGQEQAIVVVGLDRAGKSSFIKSLEAGEFVEDVKTTQQPEEHDVFPKDLNMHARMFDMAGQVKFRDWLVTLFFFRHVFPGGKSTIQLPRRSVSFYYSASLISSVFVVDSANRARFPEAKTELQRILQADWLKTLQLPILVLGNKQDLPVRAARRLRHQRHRACREPPQRKNLSMRSMSRHT